jgi:transposase InsO family protein
MDGLSIAWGVALHLVGFVWESVSYGLVFVSAFVGSRAKLAAEVVALRSQLAACRDRVDRKQAPQPRFTPAFRFVWVVLSRLFDGWEKLAHLMQPATVKRWHREGFGLYWRWKSRKPGRPPICSEMHALIRRLSRQNPIWSAERVRDTLLLLGYQPPCDDTIRKYMVKPRKPREPSTTWLPFLRNHLDVTWAMDFFTVTAINFATVYVFLGFEHGRRRVVHIATTPHPSMQWVIQQLRNAMPFGSQPRCLLRDNDGIYGDGVALFLKSCGIREVRTALQSPWQSPYIERFIGTLRRELLNHIIVLNQHHLDRLLTEFIEEYYHVPRAHQGLGGETPVPMKDPPHVHAPTRLVATPLLGGLHRRYTRIAA